MPNHKDFNAYGSHDDNTLVYYHLCSDPLRASEITGKRYRPEHHGCNLLVIQGTVIIRRGAKAMIRSVVGALGLVCGITGHAYGWGQEGHAIVAEIAQRRLDAQTLIKVETLLKREAPQLKTASISLASIASWADDYRTEHAETTNWHFTNLPFGRPT